MTSHSDSKWSFHTSPFRVEESVSISFQPLVTLLLRAKSIRQNDYISKGCGNQWFQQTVTNRNKPSWTSDVLVPSVRISRWLKSNVVPGFTWIHLNSPGFTWILLLAFPLPSLPFVRQCDRRCSNEVCRHGKSTESTESTVQALHVS